MKQFSILALTNKLLTSEDSGWTRRLYPFMEKLKSYGHYVTILALYEDDKELEKVEPETKYYNKIIPVKINRSLCYFRMLRAFFTGRPFKQEFDITRDVELAIAKELENHKYNILYSHFYKMEYYLQKYSNYKRIVDLCDCGYIVYDRQLQQEKNMIKKLFITSERDRILRLEQNSIKNYDKCIYISPLEQDCAEGKDNLKKSIAIANGVDTDYFSNNIPISKRKKEIVYVGTMASSGNHNAVVNFIKNIYPIIKTHIPDVRFTVVGSNPKKELLNLANQDKSITITGRVDDVRKYIASAKVSVAPVLIVTGLQNKILETMSMEIPTVTTIAGAEGITTDSDFLLIGEDNEDFAEKVCKILNDETNNEDIAIKSRQFCIDNYSWDACAKKLEELMLNVVNE